MNSQARPLMGHKNTLKSSVCFEGLSLLAHRSEVFNTAELEFLTFGQTEVKAPQQGI